MINNKSWSLKEITFGNTSFKQFLDTSKMGTTMQKHMKHIALHCRNQSDAVHGAEI